MHRADRAANWCATVRTLVFKTVYAISKPNKLVKSNKKNDSPKPTLDFYVRINIYIISKL